MTMVRLPSAAAIAALAMTATTWTAPAQAAAAVDAPMATADAQASAPASVADQIDAYLKSSPALELPPSGADGVVPREEPRKVHGVASVSVGTDGYRSAYLRTDLPVGKTGTLSIAVQETRFGRNGYGYGGYGRHGGARSLGVGLSFDAAQDEGATCRSAWNGGRPAGFAPPPGERLDCVDGRPARYD